MTLGIPDEYSVDATCFTWVSFNRIATGHSDGSIALWSIFPRCMLLRHPVHTTYVLDISSAYPSSPYLVASTPVGGCTTLTDLSRPSAEMAYVPTPGINFQPNMLVWHEHMQGFVGFYPSPSAGNTHLGFFNLRYFPQPRMVFTGNRLPMCISMGATHPFLLVGCADGSLWSCNAVRKVFFMRDEILKKIKIFEHEYRPVKQQAGPGGSGPPKIRGAVRTLQSFLPEVNDNPRTESMKQANMQKRVQKSKAKGGKQRRPSTGHDVADLEAEELGTTAAEVGPQDPVRSMIHEPLTRITAVAWNPNFNFSCWAAAAMGSGLVRVMDLGIA